MATWTCQSCQKSWEASREPTECSRCRGRLLSAVVSPNLGASAASFGFAPSFAGGPSYSAAPPIGSPLAARSGGSTVFTWYAWLLWSCFALVLVGTIVSVVAIQSNEQDVLALGGALVIFGMLAGIPAAVLGFIILYRGWCAVQPLRHMDPNEHNMPTPGKAIGFLFIPLFNLYWAFVAYYGLARRANRLLADRRTDGRLFNDGLALTYVIMMLLGSLSLVPLLGVLYATALFVIAFLVHRDIDRITRILTT